jgi:hypothetical protein
LKNEIERLHKIINDMDIASKSNYLMIILILLNRAITINSWLKFNNPHTKGYNKEKRRSRGLTHLTSFCLPIARITKESSLKWFSSSLWIHARSWRQSLQSQ